MKPIDKILQYLINTFYGSGNYDGDCWFIGMEEGGGNTLERVQTRIKAWQDLGETELVDMYDFHILINYSEYFTNPVKLQRTWMQYARIILAAKGLPSTTPDVKAYQRDIIGRKQSETCLLELLPLPSPGLSSWYYDKWTDIPYLKKPKDLSKSLPTMADSAYSVANSGVSAQTGSFLRRKLLQALAEDRWSVRAVPKTKWLLVSKIR